MPTLSEPLLSHLKDVHAPITKHSVALMLSDLLFHIPSEREIVDEGNANEFVQGFLKDITTSKLNLKDEDALQGELYHLIAPFFQGISEEDLHQKIAEMMNAIEAINYIKPKHVWKETSNSYGHWRSAMKHEAKQIDELHGRSFADDVLNSITFHDHPSRPDSLIWREGGLAQQWLENLYVLVLNQQMSLTDGLSQFEYLTGKELSAEIKKDIEISFVEHQLDEPAFKHLMAIPDRESRMETLRPLVEKWHVHGKRLGKEVLEKALDALDAAYAHTKTLVQDTHQKAVAKWGVEQVRGFGVGIAMIGFLLQNGQHLSTSSHVSSDKKLHPTEQQPKQMISKDSISVVSGHSSPSSWADRVSEKQKKMHHTISAKVIKLVPAPKKGAVIDTRVGKHKSAYMDQHTISHTLEKLKGASSDEALIDVFMDKWIWEVEDFDERRYFDGKKTKEYPNGYPTIGLGFNLVRHGAKSTFISVLDCSGKDFEAYFHGQKSLSKKDAVKLARHDVTHMLEELKQTLGKECWERLNEPQRFAALDLYYNNSGTLMGHETVQLFQNAAATNNFETLARTIADKRNASDLGGSNLRRQANAEFIAGHDMSLKSKALVRQVLAPALKKAHDGDTILVRVTREASIPALSHVKKYATLPEGKSVQIVPVMSEVVDGVACDIPCGKAISVVGTPNGIKATAIALDSTTKSTGYLWSSGGKIPTAPSFQR